MPGEGGAQGQKTSPPAGSAAGGPGPFGLYNRPRLTAGAGVYHGSWVSTTRCATSILSIPQIPPSCQPGICGWPQGPGSGSSCAAIAAGVPHGRSRAQPAGPPATPGQRTPNPATGTQQPARWPGAEVHKILVLFRPGHERGDGGPPPGTADRPKGGEQQHIFC